MAGRVVMTKVQESICLRMRRMAKSDLNEVVRIEQAIYPQAWSASLFGEELSRNNRYYIVLEVDEVIVGYGGLMIVDSDAHVTTIAVDPQFQSRGFGTRLMISLVDAALSARADHLTLEVRVSNEGARNLYRRFGFVPVGLRKDYYRDEDALVMWATDIDGTDFSKRIANIRTSVEAKKQ